MITNEINKVPAHFSFEENIDSDANLIFDKINSKNSEQLCYMIFNCFLKITDNSSFVVFKNMFRFPISENELNSMAQEYLLRGRKETTEFAKKLINEAKSWDDENTVSIAIKYPNSYALYQLMKLVVRSSSITFSEWISELKTSYHVEFLTYNKLEKEFFPELGFDKVFIFDELRKKNRSIETIIPPQYRD